MGEAFPNKKILIIEDSNIARKKLIQFLSVKGYDIIEAGNGLIGLDVISKQQIDCVLCDLLMPQLTGIGVLRHLYNHNIDTPPVIIISADVQETTRDEVFELGAVAFINKPPKQDVLLSTVEKALGKKRGERL